MGSVIILCLPPGVTVMSRTGDWKCPTCGDANFASRGLCRKCSRPKPVHIGAAQRKPGDWKCTKCGDLNFASRQSCRKCIHIREAVDHAMSATNAGDWNCSCGEVNFARRDTCRKCNQAKTALVATPANGALDAASASATPSTSFQRKPGDWDCSECDETNFGTRVACRACGIERPGGFKAPSDWAPQSKECELVALTAEDETFGTISARFHQTMPSTSKICTIQRIQNQWLWRKYSTELACVAEKNGGLANMTRALFHGTSSTDPKLVYQGEDGFDMRFSRNGMWGQGIYFAANASYSHNYAYASKIQSAMQKNQFHYLFYSTVIVGEILTCPPDSTLRLPPVKPTPVSNKQFAVERYDSVCGQTGGSDVFIVYANSKAYPSYLISYIA